MNTSSTTCTAISVHKREHTSRTMPCSNYKAMHVVAIAFLTMSIAVNDTRMVLGFTTMPSGSTYRVGGIIGKGGKVATTSSHAMIPFHNIAPATTTTQRTNTVQMNSSSSISNKSNTPPQNKRTKARAAATKLYSALLQKTRTIQNLFSKLKPRSHKIKTMIASLILFSSVFFSSFSSHAAVGSGGRMGGSFGRSYSPSRSRSRSYSRSYSRPSYYNRGYGYNRCRPNIIIGADPFYRPFWWSPRTYYPRAPPAQTTTVVTEEGGTTTTTTTVAAVPHRPLFSNLLDFLVVGGVSYAFALALVSMFKNDYNDWNSPSSFSSRSLFDTTSALGNGISVVQLTVALNVSDRDDMYNSILYKLKELSDTARTDTRVGVQNLTSQVALELLRRKQYIVASSSKYFHFNNEIKAERVYNDLTIEERSKFEKETVSKYGGVNYNNNKQKLIQGNNNASEYNDKATMAVVTILLSIDGDNTKVPTKIHSLSDIEKGLRLIASDAKVGSCLRGAEILWTPEERTETLSRRDMFVDYPELRIV